MTIKICCNDPDNGLFDGKASAIHIGSLRLACRFLDWSPKLTEGDVFIRIGGKKLRCYGSRYGVGNWCWNAYGCDDADVEALVNWPKFRKWFDVEEASPRVFDAYRAGRKLVLRKKRVEA